jgi:hypothetical protein
MRAHLTVELKNRSGETLAVRRAHNAVMQDGAKLIARLFAGTGGAITHMGVGTSDAPDGDNFATAALSNAAIGDAAPLTAPTEAAIPPEAFAIDVNEATRTVRVRVRGTLPDAAAVGTVREAGLVAHVAAEIILYNRVTFAPIIKGNDHELTLFWEVTFPYGDLQAVF